MRGVWIKDGPSSLVSVGPQVWMVTGTDAEGKEGAETCTMRIWHSEVRAELRFSERWCCFRYRVSNLVSLSVHSTFCLAHQVYNCNSGLSTRLFLLKCFSSDILGGVRAQSHPCGGWMAACLRLLLAGTATRQSSANLCRSCGMFWVGYLRSSLLQTGPPPTPHRNRPCARCRTGGWFRTGHVP